MNDRYSLANAINKAFHLSHLRRLAIALSLSVFRLLTNESLEKQDRSDIRNTFNEPWRRLISKEFLIVVMMEMIMKATAKTILRNKAGYTAQLHKMRPVY